MQEWFNILKSINVIYNIKRMKVKIIGWSLEIQEKDLTNFDIHSWLKKIIFSILDIERMYVKVIKAIYEIYVKGAIYDN